MLLVYEGCWYAWLVKRVSRKLLFVFKWWCGVHLEILCKKKSSIELAVIWEIWNWSLCITVATCSCHFLVVHLFRIPFLHPNFETPNGTAVFLCTPALLLVQCTLFAQCSSAFSCIITHFHVFPCDHISTPHALTQCMNVLLQFWQGNNEKFVICSWFAQASGCPSPKYEKSFCVCEMRSPSQYVLDYDPCSTVIPVLVGIFLKVCVIRLKSKEESRPPSCLLADMSSSSNISLEGFVQGLIVTSFSLSPALSAMKEAWTVPWFISLTHQLLSGVWHHWNHIICLWQECRVSLSPSSNWGTSWKDRTYLLNLSFVSHRNKHARIFCMTFHGVEAQTFFLCRMLCKKPDADTTEIRGFQTIFLLPKAVVKGFIFSSCIQAMYHVRDVWCVHSVVWAWNCSILGWLCELRMS